MARSPEHRYLNWAIGGAVALLLGCGGLASCWVASSNPDQPRPSERPAASPTAEVVPSGTPEPSSSPEPYYKTCTDAVKANVPLPIRSNEPGYRVALDGDEDGKACE